MDGSSQTAVTELLDDVIPLLHTSKQNNLLVSTPTNEQYSSTDGTATLMIDVEHRCIRWNCPFQSPYSVTPLKWGAKLDGIVALGYGHVVTGGIGRPLCLFHVDFLVPVVLLLRHWFPFGRYYSHFQALLQLVPLVPGGLSWSRDH